jgi:hypothetical protein
LAEEDDEGSVADGREVCLLGMSDWEHTCLAEETGGFLGPVLLRFCMLCGLGEGLLDPRGAFLQKTIGLGI